MVQGELCGYKARCGLNPTLEEQLQEQKVVISETEPGTGGPRGLSGHMRFSQAA